MLRRSQISALLALSFGLWLIATLYIRLAPGALLNPVRGSVSFILALPLGWLSIRLVKAAGRLSNDQLMPGVMLVGAAAMIIDGAALRWCAGVYGSDEKVLRLGSAWLLWGYGVSLALALLMTPRKSAPEPH